MEKSLDQPLMGQDYRKRYIKNVLVKHLHAVYYCKLHVLEYLLQAKDKIQSDDLQDRVNTFIVELREHIHQLNQFYEELRVQPDSSFMTGIKSYTLEAMVAYVMQSKVTFEKELIMLSYLEVICAINYTHICILERMTKSLMIPDTLLEKIRPSCKAIGDAIENMLDSYLA
jgi:hypothetical protein